jgi:1,4-dihydroxy-6-naphthoate synthase
MNIIDVAFSPCPNDTFLFEGWVHGKINSPLQVIPHLADIQQLNHWAKMGKYPVTKVSAYCMSTLFSTYEMASVGAAVSLHGPKLIAARAFDLGDIHKKVLAVPGMDTTAYFLFCSLFGTCKSAVFCRYEQIIDLVLSGKADAGIIIHETRFTCHKYPIVELADLGALFFEKYQLPVPLGCIAIKKDLPQQIKHEITQALQQSLELALSHPAGCMDYVMKHAQEPSEEVAQKHIAAFVTPDTLMLSDKGRQAFSLLFDSAQHIQLG